jgi:predicted RNase H-like nuclease (RuvC/YqgF family)
MALGDPQFGKTINRLREENETLKAEVARLRRVLVQREAKIQRLGSLLAKSEMRRWEAVDSTE